MAKIHFHLSLHMNISEALYKMMYRYRGESSLFIRNYMEKLVKNYTALDRNKYFHLKFKTKVKQFKIFIKIRLLSILLNYYTFLN